MTASTVDHSALKVNQAGIILTVLVAFAGSAFSAWFEAAHPGPRRCDAPRHLAA